jgi:hypothetical protein
MQKLEGFEKVESEGILGEYYIHPDGRIYRDYGHRIKFLSERPNAYGYSRISLLHQDGRRVDRMMHRLLMLTFVPNPDNKPQVNHKDGDKSNNQLSNLEWVTDRENKLHSHRVLGAKSSDKSCFLFYFGGFVQRFPNIQAACNYAAKKYGCSSKSLCKYYTSNGCAIITEESATTILTE